MSIPPASPSAFATPAARALRFLAAVACLAALGCASSPARDAGSLERRGGRVGWERLIIPNRPWSRHTDQDPKLATFIRNQTTLNIDPVWYRADPRQLDQLSSYPFIYAKELPQFEDPDVLANLREYLNRCGTLFVDPCTNGFSQEEKAEFRQRHAAVFHPAAPNLQPP